MKKRRLVIALGLAALLLAAGSVVGCGPAPSGQASGPSENQGPANPMEDITNPDNSDDETSATMEFSIEDEDIPEGQMAADGTIEKVSGNTFDLRQEKLEIVVEGNVGRVKEGSQPEVRLWQVVFSSDTEVLRLIMSGEGKMKTEKIGMQDIQEGRKAYVWGEVDGSRIFADSIVLWY